MRIPKAATGTTGVGWVYSLRNLPDSDWGSVDEFYESVLEGRRSKEFSFEANVWGTFRKASHRPDKGDGIAFYHAANAKYPKNDQFKRRPRVSLVGTIEGVTWEGQEIRALHFRANTKLSRFLRKQPMLRTKETEEFFSRCGIVRSSIATMYSADAVAWYILDAWMKGHVAET